MVFDLCCGVISAVAVLSHGGITVVFVEYAILVECFIVLLWYCVVYVIGVLR